jgi:hypothetical protein
MASKFVCRCGEVVRTNLFEGHNLHLMVPERRVDAPGNEQTVSPEALLDSIVMNSDVVAKCRNCGCLAVIDKHYGISLYEQVSAH